MMTFISSKKPLLILLVSLILGVLSGVTALSANRDDNHPPIYTIGELIKQDGFEIKLHSSNIEKFDETNSGMTFNYVIVDLSITNLSNMSLPFIPVFQSHIRRADDTVWDMSPFLGLINPISAGDIDPGDTISGELSYLIADTNQKLIFMFDPGWGEATTIFIEL